VPLGLQVVGEMFEQAMILQVIRAYAQATPGTPSKNTINDIYFA
jgi:Asp-tRNA(Asn)/Glu-tRNA(Gln) amidotransferase A subunit family amidase